MKSTTLAFFALLTIFSGTQGLADWTDEVLRTVPEYQQPFPNPYEASTWRAANVPWLTPSDLSNAVTEHFGRMRLAAFYQRKNGKNIRAPLMVILPGIFSNYKAYEVLREAQRFQKLGYHVLTFSNPWAFAWIMNRLEITPGDIRAESQAVVETLEEYLAIHHDEVSSVHLFGYSYGAFLGAVVAARTPLIDGDVTLVGPPFDLERSFRKLDQLADANFAAIRPIDDIELKALRFMGRNAPSEVYWNPAQSAAVAVYGGFIEDLEASAETYAWHHGNRQFEPQGLDPDALRDWRRHYRFRDYLVQFFPNFKNVIAAGDGKLSSWLDRARQRGRHVRVLTADDDFINSPGDWGPQQASPELIVLPRGGHLGYLGMDWFERLIDLAAACH